MSFCLIILAGGDSHRFGSNIGKPYQKIAGKSLIEINVIKARKFKQIKIVFKTHYPLISILRVSGFFLGFSLYYFSLSKISLPEAVTLFFVSPFFVTIFSKFIIGEW